MKRFFKLGLLFSFKRDNIGISDFKADKFWEGFNILHINISNNN